MKNLDAQMLKNRVEATLAADMEAGRVGGAALLVIQGEQTVYRGCFGNEALGITVTEETQFRMASMTKPVTAVAVMLLEERGLLKLSDPVSRYLPSFSRKKLARMNGEQVALLGEAQAPITVHSLLTHSSGLGSGPVGDWYDAHRPGESMERLKAAVEFYGTLPLDFTPGTAMAYSPVFGFDVLARIVELVSGTDYETFLRREIFEPLGMVNTTFAPDPEQWSRMIPMHNRVDGRSKVADFPKNSIFAGFPVTYTAGGAGLTSTLADYEKFARMLLRGGASILSPETVARMATPQLSLELMPGQAIWGLGMRVVVSEEYEDLAVGSFGWSGAYGTHFWVEPENRITAIYLKNSLYDGGSGSCTGRAFERDVHRSLQ